MTGASILAPALSKEDRVGRIPLSPETTLGPERSRRLDPFSQVALVAVEFARREAGLARWDRQCKSGSEGVALGSALGAVTTTVRYARRLLDAGPNSTNPIDFPDSVDGAAAGHVAMDLGLGGPSITFADGAASAVDALVHAARQIAWGRATRMHVVAGDRFDPFFAQALARDPTLQGVCPAECVVALIIEPCASTADAEPCVTLTGFLPDAMEEHAETQGTRASAAPLRSARDGLTWQVDAQGIVTCARGIDPSRTRVVNPSGALELAAALLAVRGPRTHLFGATVTDTAPEPFVPCGGQCHPELAFIAGRK